jgi:arginyl-tRNA--protein-N-Asp/Glu arginylyltransferase
VKPVSHTHGNVTPAPHAVFKKYQMAVHHEEDSDCSQSQFKSFLVDSPLKQVAVFHLLALELLWAKSSLT